MDAVIAEDVVNFEKIRAAQIDRRQPVRAVVGRTRETDVVCVTRKRACPGDIDVG